MAAKTEIIEIKPVQMREVNLTVVGDTPLIVHAWSTKAKRMMLEAQMGLSKGKKKATKNPVEDFINSLYWLTPMPETHTEEAFEEAIANGAKFGFKATAIKAAAISAAFRLGMSKDKASLRPAFFINSLEDDMVEIISDPPTMREDMVVIGMGTADIRYRGEFRNWRIPITLKFNENGQYSLESIINMLNAGGYACGIGEWRVEKDGSYGCFHIEAGVDR